MTTMVTESLEALDVEIRRQNEAFHTYSLALEEAFNADAPVSALHHEGRARLSQLLDVMQIGMRALERHPDLERLGGVPRAEYPAIILFLTRFSRFYELLLKADRDQARRDTM
jgi:hypothetical protein